MALIYWVCWFDPLDGTHGAVRDEGPMDEWAEAEEVATYYRAEDDGLKYFVGDKTGEVLHPTLEEVRWDLRYVLEHWDDFATQIVDRNQIKMFRRYGRAVTGRPFQLAAYAEVQR